MEFSDSRDNYLNDVNNSIRSRFNESIIILKKVTSIRQLRNTEKEWVRLCYKEAILKGFTMVNEIQCYIASKTKIWIERSGIEFLKKSEVEEDKRWYSNLASDHFAYVGVYRKTIDELEQYKREMWSVMTDPEATNIEKIQATRELHNLTRTHTLLLRDLPFVINLSKYYDRDLINANLHQQTGFQNTLDNNKNEKEIIDRKVSECFKKLVDESALLTPEQWHKMGIDMQTNREEKIVDRVMEEMRKQLIDKDHVEKMLNSREYYESIKKIREIED